MLRTTFAAVICFGLASAAQATLITDIAADYSSTQGGNGYTYGSLEYTFGGPPDITTFTTSHMPTTATPNGYFGDYNSGCCGTAYPQVQAPITANDQFNQLLFHGVTNPSEGVSSVGGSALPLNTTVASDVRWTSTYTGLVNISGEFRAYNFCCGESQSPYVFVNGVAKIGNNSGTADTNLASPIVDTSRSTAVGPAAGESSAGFDSGATNQGGVFYGPLHLYSFNVFLNAGDTVDWVSDPRAGFFGDLTLVSGQINSVPEPTTLALQSLGAIGLLWVAARRRRAAH